MAPIASRNVVHNLRERLAPGYYGQLDQRRLRGWRERLAAGTLTPDMLTSAERVQLQTWIIEHPTMRKR